MKLSRVPGGRDLAFVIQSLQQPRSERVSGNNSARDGIDSDGGCLMPIDMRGESMRIAPTTARAADAIVVRGGRRAIVALYRDASRLGHDAGMFLREQQRNIAAIIDQ